MLVWVRVREYESVSTNRETRKQQRSGWFFTNLIGCHLLLNVKLYTHSSTSYTVASTQLKWDTHNQARVFNRFEMNERIEIDNETKL